jgi:hypothetical protein
VRSSTLFYFVRATVSGQPIAAILSGANGWNEIENYGKAKREWLSSFLRLPGGILSHDTFNRVFAALAPEELENGFAAWVGSIARVTAGSGGVEERRQARRRF